MEFRPDKCQVLTICRKRNPVRYEYVLHGHKLQHVDSAKYLGVTMTSDFSWNKHVDNVVNKANGTLGFLRRNLQISSPSLKTTAYTSLVRPVLEYASTVWDPYTKSCIDKMEIVQRRAARNVLHRYHNTSSVGKMLDTLLWTSLEERRNRQRLVMLYKIQHGQVAVKLHL